MQTYLVGGAVRDLLLGYPVKDRDYVVVGADVATMLAAGYEQVGKDFPVFLHPHTKAEYALARTERKTGAGYSGFAVQADASVTLEQDLLRRDLTINAMAQADDGTIIDPFGGQDDLKQRVFRHVSPAFVEDPLRVLRVARFMARYQHYGFQIAPETMALLQQVATSGALAELAAPRVWTETQRALQEPNAFAYWQVLQSVGGLADWFPELEAAFTQPTILAQVEQSYLHPHPEIGHLAVWAPHLSQDDFTKLCVRLPLATEDAQVLRLFKVHFQTLLNVVANATSKTKENTETAHTTAQTVLSVLQNCDVARRPQRMATVLDLTAWILQSTGQITLSHTLTQAWQLYIDAFSAVDVQAIIRAGHRGAGIKTEQQVQQISAIAKCM